MEFLVAKKMKNLPVAAFLQVAGLLLLLLALFSGHLRGAAAQNCGCDPSLCCSQWGYCGTGDDYCGPGCREGPCYPSGGGGGGGGGSSSVADIVRQSFFDGIANQASSGCEGKGFYTRDAFINSLGAYSGFGQDGSDDANKREVAAFFANAAHETGYFCYINEIGGGTFCDTSSAQYPCAPGQQYYGRGPLQLTWNTNYGPAGQAIGFDGLNNPGAVAADPTTSFSSALWYWMNDVHGVVGQGFGATINAINGPIECNGGNTAEMNDRVSIYQNLCAQLGVSPGDNLTC